MAFLINLYLRPFFDELSCRLGLRYLVNLKTKRLPVPLAGSVTSTKIAMLGIHWLNQNEHKQHKIAVFQRKLISQNKMFSVLVDFACIF